MSDAFRAHRVKQPLPSLGAQHGLVSLPLGVDTTTGSVSPRDIVDRR
ncbi:hypothetical protein AB0Q95_05025 [Streptomyces sp. NPDC059900]